MRRNKALGDAYGFPNLRHWPTAPVCGGRKPGSACQTL